MNSDNRRKLLAEIFRVFPLARIISKSENVTERFELLTNGAQGLAERPKERNADSAACKHNVVDHRQLSLFDQDKGGGK